jgi:hypothetical protein
LVHLRPNVHAQRRATAGLDEGWCARARPRGACS